MGVFSYIVTLYSVSKMNRRGASMVCSDVSDDSFRLFLTLYRDYLNTS